MHILENEPREVSLHLHISLTNPTEKMVLLLITSGPVEQELHFQGESLQKVVIMTPQLPNHFRLGVLKGPASARGFPHLQHEDVNSVHDFQEHYYPRAGWDPPFLNRKFWTSRFFADWNITQILALVKELFFKPLLFVFKKSMNKMSKFWGSNVGHGNYG